MNVREIADAQKSEKNEAVSDKNIAARTDVQATAKKETQTDAGLTRFNYKFQRLRERIRSAIEAGELSGKLPGERVLAERFKVNTKTLGKALSDLAAEGVLDRSMGRGTFVRNVLMPRAAQRPLFLCDDAIAHQGLIAHLGKHNIHVQMCDTPTELPPSLLNPFRAVIVRSARVSDEALRDLVVRGKTVVLIDRVSAHYATHAVLQNHAAAAADLARRLVSMGHRTIGIIEDGVSSEITDFVRISIGADILDSAINLISGMLNDVQTLLETHIDKPLTALICTSGEIARYAAGLCRASGRTVPDQISVVAIARMTESPRFTGQYIDDAQIAEAVARLLRDGSPHKPVTLLLTGIYTDMGTAVINTVR
jgi:DNA-binding transcriptional regulator YhcF (GntR family)